MINDLNIRERQSVLAILGFVALVGLLMAVAGRNDPMGVHGWLVLILGFGGFFLVAGTIYDPEPVQDRANAYHDAPIKVGLVLAMIWAVFAMFVGVWVAAELAWPTLNFETSWLLISTQS